MPASLPHAREIDSPQAPGTGGRPPMDRRHTGGGGGGGGDNEKGHQSRGPRDLLLRVRTGLFLALAIETSIFLLIGAALISGHSGAFLHGPISTSRLLEADLLVLLLFASSATIEMARRQIFVEIDVLEEWLGLGKPALRRALPWLGATLILGSALLAGLRLIGSEIPGSNTPLLVTGSLFATHVALGCAVLFLSLFGLRSMKRVELRQVTIDATAWYWHAMTGFGALFLLALHFGA